MAAKRIKKIVVSETQKKRHERLLIELTSLPTGTGKEHAVVRYLYDWVARRAWVSMKRDKWGNVLLGLKGRRAKRPVVLTSHLDHPAFVVYEVKDGGREVWAEFRGGVHNDYFVGTKVRWWSRVEGELDKIKCEQFEGKDSYQTLIDLKETKRGEVAEVFDADEKNGQMFKQAKICFLAKNKVKTGDLLTWDLRESKVVRCKLNARVCDDLAVTAASLTCFERWYERNKNKLKEAHHVQVLFTRAEEVGFIGAMGACQSGLIADDARLIALENSKSIPGDSPQGAGPIVRVGDATSTFGHELNYRISQIAKQLTGEDETFQYQRKLMPGGSCEATAYQCYGYQTTCLCLPLVNYHNMNEQTKKIDVEVIDMRDYHNMVKLLIGVCERLDNGEVDGLRRVLDDLFEKRKHVLS
ncbi:hypothetical protein [Poriferisphaera corsica]|nr:hypothetical protein [Poriferisphaera corsica]